ncbi:MAG: D-alanine--D-alanine ligase family protein [Elusimicrobiota bacterium]|jgi:D-alanine-D-alanine ligase
MRVLVLFGGRSAEREVSCVSAQSVLRNLGRHQPILVWIDPQGRWWHQRRVKEYLAHKKPARFPFERVAARLEPGPRPALVAGARRFYPDVAFPVLHGPFGEDGTMQGHLEIVGLPYVGCGVLGSSAGMDKAVTKVLAARAGLPQVPYALLKDPRDLVAARRLKLPVFVKPSRLGSSVGVYKVKKSSELAAAVRKAFRFDSEVLVEQGVSAREIECAVIGEGRRTRVAKTVGEIRPNAEFYSYEAKYLDPDGAELIIPAKLSKSAAETVRALSRRAFDAVCGFGMARVDFFLDKRTGRFYFNEVNTIPGFTSISQFPKLWAESGLAFPKLVDELLKLAVARHRDQAKLRITRD